MIFDECHNAHKDHPMHQLMAYFLSASEEDLPRVIGLTGMLTSTSVKPQNVINDLKQLENTFQSTIATVKGLDAFADVLLYSTSATEQTVLYPTYILPNILKIITEKVNKIVESIGNWPIDHTHERSSAMALKADRTPNPLKKLKTLWNDYLYHLQDLGLF